ncbi:conserved hypothetical protein [Formosa agariphila KMM 3901]|uniref:Outermembrane protein n=1 Tax=Formosa agariphila (strain DSM 15362 / KCTC 12365 / LMG 23005 / KMM 3901 / M-2Alg 35-1) TaxID=1347342 RepID=T2KP57_FORAG|nr:hypothetical protein [Formosa agariphila]CDF80241.1 conserved hypothetical protein [Formosa agariphila KMM 3901]
MNVKTIIFLIGSILLPLLNLNAQTTDTLKYTASNKGKFFVSWGGNRDYYSKSDITFTGDNYNFTLYDVDAHDKPKGWHIDYINPVNMTIPQTNFRMGYFISDHYAITVSLDHMKYVMTQNQVVRGNGYIDIPDNEESAIYNNTFKDDPVYLSEGFLTFEHTDGLNYIHTELARFDDISSLFGITNTDVFQINITEAVGGGILYPKTNAKLLVYDRHDDFHIAGFGLSASAGLNLTFFKHFFIQGDLKGGFINMPDIRTTMNPSDRASQHFFFGEAKLSIGGIFRL